FLGAGDHAVHAEAEVNENGVLLEQEFLLTVETAADADRDGLVDLPFAALASEGDFCTAATRAGGMNGTTAMLSCFGDCDESADDEIALRVRNPANAAQMLTVRLDRALLACGEQGFLTVALGGLGNIFGSAGPAQVPLPEGLAANSP